MWVSNPQADYWLISQSHQPTITPHPTIIRTIVPLYNMLIYLCHIIFWILNKMITTLPYQILALLCIKISFNFNFGVLMYCDYEYVRIFVVIYRSLSVIEFSLSLDKRIVYLRSLKGLWSLMLIFRDENEQTKKYYSLKILRFFFQIYFSIFFRHVDTHNTLNKTVHTVITLNWLFLMKYIL